MHDQALARATKKNPRKVRLHLRDGRTLEGQIYFTERDYLAAFLSSRKRCVSVTEATWVGIGGEPIDHLVVPVSVILWASAPDGDLALLNAPPAAEPRSVEVFLDGGLVVTGNIHLVAAQRLSDFFDGAECFLPVTDTRLLPRGQALGEVAVARDAVQALRELSAS
jgi:hypothetical protein